jgi:hypothetical protein
MFFMYAAILALLNRRLSLATLLYSYALCPPPDAQHVTRNMTPDSTARARVCDRLGVSVKMNLLLFLPDFGLILAMEVQQPYGRHIQFARIPR